MQEFQLALKAEVGPCARPAFGLAFFERFGLVAMSRRAAPISLAALALVFCSTAWVSPSVARPVSAVTMTSASSGSKRSGALFACFAFATAGPLLFSLASMAMTAKTATTTRQAAPFGCIEDGATDPSLFVQTNVKLGDKKMEFMKAASKAVAGCLGKPESYVAVSVQDGQDIIWGGSEAPCALCKVISLGSINKENNGALTKQVSELLAEFDVPANRIYVNFFDLERQNVGYNGATFAG